MGTIPYGRQDITPEDIAAVVDVLQSDWLTQGPKVPEFEAALASYCGARYAVVVSSATAALHLACIAAGLQGGDRLWTSPITFVASANCGLYCGATVDFVDIDPHTYNLSVSALADKLAMAKKQGTLPKVVIPVHLAGQSCEMAALAELAQTYGFMLIEDASHALGGQYRGRPIGCCEFSTMAVFSFHPVKIITTGEGGAVLTNDPDLYQCLIRLRSHGITRDPQQMVSDSHGPWYYQQLELGFNYRMTDLQAALGLRQLQRLDLFVERRRFLAQRYHQYLADLPLTLPFQHPDTRSSWHLYIIRLKRDQIQTSHREVFEALRALGIGVNLHYIPVHTQPYYQQLGFQWGDFPNAEAYYQEAISLPLYYGLTLAQQDQVIQALKQVLA
ncbi:UDP-4-amino-4,6-dideoxy-N-acetyl-beta-L-altrosamine transaminase [Thermosynechococcus sp. QKsg1]|uniref:UDP-4-amino-4, 6-dideoxy-N-acetyl-beta-L-altrosamine transaminase n=1 Tax=unclassified Thermosynechococcus TaxID=2622553 RepID=UPI002670D372|nr:MULTISPECIES: UDP-4-amino-4,6-dideoxy-N-acetyl-beta-L-altrosamine transaminase [unclassified Thermosynechococcus]WKT83866.1 UDP-4-amino-4,6-dideoxy-N-acetyl-beta-L-altrosamine transaminase [Thermosynechococcus sp. HY596]WNC62997.1 UDP-4-amino-4,6-dideoxy-N-acetyl-beta-L-altrosamine transaminase [Thermosynechococcus sp. HY591]WNC65557.1 UDP-4-amino-4,6-dideoxy-N-acetyl-beta-L-altrosamine transaminase [Thermosynechococcus sp. HY593]WNC86872.1 UDP-4-amino-4,6-dideoxy-N-acetyl-beta-L-altrosamine